MTSHLDRHGTTDIKPEMLSGVQTGNGIWHVEYNIPGRKKTFKSKDDYCKALYIYIYMNSSPQNKIDPPPKKEIKFIKKNAHAKIAYSACTIPPLRHF